MATAGRASSAATPSDEDFLFGSDPGASRFRRREANALRAILARVQYLREEAADCEGRATEAAARAREHQGRIVDLLVTAEEARDALHHIRALAVLGSSPLARQPGPARHIMETILGDVLRQRRDALRTEALAARTTLGWVPRAVQLQVEEFEYAQGSHRLAVRHQRWYSRRAEWVADRRRRALAKADARYRRARCAMGRGKGCTTEGVAASRHRRQDQQEERVAMAPPGTGRGAFGFPPPTV